MATHSSVLAWRIPGTGAPPSLENPRDGGAWRAAIYGVEQSRTRLKRLSSSSSIVSLYSVSPGGGEETFVQVKGPQ